jgi:hypothetical protein
LGIVAACPTGWRTVADDVRIEEGWPASSDATARSIELPAAGGKPADTGGEPSTPTPPPDDGDKIARLDERRSRHGGD